MSIEDASVEAPEPVLVNRRWIKPGTVKWAKDANEILEANGAVFGTKIHEKRHHARHPMERLLDLLVDLGLQKRADLVGHVNRRGDGYVWAVEYRPRRRN